MLEPTLDSLAEIGLLVDVGSLHLDRGYDSGGVRDRLRLHGIDQFEIQRHGTKRPGDRKTAGTARAPLDRRSHKLVVIDYGQVRRSTDRSNRRGHIALCLLTTILIVGRLIDWRNLWNPPVAPIRSGLKGQ